VINTDIVIHDTPLQAGIVKQLYKNKSLTQAYLRIRFNIRDTEIWDSLLLLLTHIGAVSYHKGPSYAASYLMLTGEARDYLDSLLTGLCSHCQANGGYPETNGPAKECDWGYCAKTST